MALLFDPAPNFDLPLTKGSDLDIDFQSVDPDDNLVLEDWPAGATLTLQIDATTPISAAATITGPHGEVHVESTLTDPVKKGTLWRLIMDYDGSNTVVCNGKVVRSDGN